MAVGDVKSDIQSKTTGAILTFQPAAGEEFLITEIGSDKFLGADPNRVPDVIVRLTNGTIVSIIRTPTGSAEWRKPLKILINNAIYLELVNNDAGTAILSFCGIQTK